MLDSPARHLDQSRLAQSHLDQAHLHQVKTAEPGADLPLRHSLAHRLCKLCSPTVAADLALLANAAVITALAVATQALYFGRFFPGRINLDDYALIGLAVGLTYFFTARFVLRLDFEAMTRGLDSGWVSAKALLIAATLFLLAVFLTKTTETHSRGWFVLWLVTSGLALTALHVVYARFFATALRLPDSPYRHRVAVFGTADLATAFAAHLGDNGGSRTDLVHRTTLTPDADETAFRHEVEALLRYCRHNPVNEIVVALPGADDARIMTAVHAFTALPVDVRLAPDRAGYALADSPYLAGTSLPLLTVSTRPIRDWGKLLKELFDRLGAAFLLLVLSPVFLAIAAAIKLESKGPVFFKQQRNGFNHRTFLMWKFRSMAEDADKQATTYRQATKNDPRITRVGAVLRKTSLDELPQLINVVRGEMSLVGPRPHPIALDNQYMALIDHYASRHAVLPGMTGWAQVNGFRGETDTEEKMAGRIAHDLHYIRNWTPTLDIWILALTVIRGFVNKNAY